MTPESQTIITRNIKELEIDIMQLQNKKRTHPKCEHYRIDKAIFLHEKILRGLRIELDEELLNINENV